MIDTIQTALINIIDAAVSCKVGAEGQNMAVPCVGVIWLGPGFMTAREVQPYRSQRYEISIYVSPGDAKGGMKAIRTYMEQIVDALYSDFDLGLTVGLRIDIEGQSMSKPDVVDKALVVRIPVTVFYHE